MIDGKTPVLVYLVLGFFLKELESKSFENLNELLSYLKESGFKLSDSIFFENTLTLKVTDCKTNDNSMLVIKNVFDKKYFFS